MLKPHRGKEFILKIKYFNKENHLQRKLINTKKSIKVPYQKEWLSPAGQFNFFIVVVVVCLFH